MKCPRCGREIQNNETFCTGCGWRVEQTSDQQNQQNRPQNYPYDLPPYGFQVPQKKEPSRVGKIVRAVGAVILFVFLMFGCQSCVMSGYMTSLMMQEGFMAELDYDAALRQAERLIEATNEKTVQILLIANLLTILIICLLFHLRRKNPVREMGLFHVNPFRIPTFALLGAALNVFVSITLTLMPLPESVVEAFDSHYEFLYGSNVVLEIISVAVVASIVEELIFRGIAMSRLKPLIGTVGAVIVSALLFGFAHGTPIAVGYATVLGVVFGLLYNSFDSVIPTIVCHVFFNAASYAFELVPEDNGIMLIGLYVLSIGAILWCVYRTFFRRPTFNDMVADKNHRIPYINETEREIISRVHEIRQRDMIDEAALDEMESLQEQWEENRRKMKNEK